MKWKFVKRKLMREIKFRGVHKGILLPPESLTQSPNHRQWLGKLDVELLQYTGLKDKNGTEIYEGYVLDIKGATCNEYDFKGIVSFYEGTFCLASLSQSDYAKKNGYLERVQFWDDGCHDHYSLEMIESFEMEVIGNVHSNPELLGAKTEEFVINKRKPENKKRIDRIKQFYSQEEEEETGVLSFMGHYDLFTSKDTGLFYFRLQAYNGATILNSNAYTTKAAAENGIESVRKNAEKLKRFNSFSDKNGYFFFLRAKNGSVIGRSEMYSSKAARDNAIESVQKNSIGPTVDLT